ncbi:MAG TPA: CaiB/BaiF CoA-transferase family protein, partial [Myxococcales bacterium]
WLEGAGTRTAAYFASTNRGKRSITIDLASGEGQAIVRRLAARADVVVENFKVGSLARLGLGHADLLAVNPRLVYCSISGFGQDGPYRDRPGYDFLLQAMGGLMSVTGEPDGVPGGGPMKVGVALTDLLTGMYAATAILAALAHRDRTGEGQHVDLSLLDVQVATLANQAESFLVTGRPPGRLGNSHPSIVPYRAFATADGHIVLAAGNDGQFARFCEVAGRPDLARDPRYATNAARVSNRGELEPLLAGILAARRSADWISALEAATVPCGPINDLAQVFSDPQVVHRGMRVQAEGAPPVPMVRSPLRLEGEAPCPPPPTLGAHTDEVLMGLLRMPPAEVAALRRAGVL